ncbi:RNA-binding protein 48 [Balamuthia mandrillaris]
MEESHILASVTRKPAVHQRTEPCETRKKYRSTKKETAVKVYTVNQESRYLIVQNVPTVGASKELINLFALYGTIEEWRFLDDYPAPEYTEVYWIRYAHIAEARFAKKKCNNYNFFGSLLHVAYAPEFETISDTCLKLEERRSTILHKLHPKRSYSSLRSPLSSSPSPSPSPSSPSSSSSSLPQVQAETATQHKRPRLSSNSSDTPSSSTTTSSSVNATVLSVRNKLQKISKHKAPRPTMTSRNNRAHPSSSSS